MRNEADRATGSVRSYFPSERTREIGIRVARGAGRGNVLRLREALDIKLAVIGVAVGLALAFGLTRFIATFLYGVALVACYVPARRAWRVDPMIALRYE